MSLPRKKIALAIGIASAAALVARVTFAQYVGPTATPPGGNVPQPVWNSRSSGFQQTNAAVNIDGGITAGGPVNITGNAQTSTVSGTLQVNTGLKLPLPSAHAGYVLTSDASGNATWAVPAAGGNTVTGNGAAGQMTYWSGTNTIAGDTLMNWDWVNKDLGIGGLPDTASRFSVNVSSGNLEGIRIIGNATWPPFDIMNAARTPQFVIQPDGTISTGKVPFGRLVAPFPPACTNGQFITTIGWPNNTCATPTLPPGTISGNGTTNTVAKFNPGPTTISNSNITDTGTQVEIASAATTFAIDGGALLVRNGSFTLPTPFNMTAGEYLYYTPGNNIFRAYYTTTGESSPGYNSAVFGYNTASQGRQSFVTGGSNSANGDYELVSGLSNTVSGYYSAATGWNNVVGGQASFTTGAFNTINGNYSLALGRSNNITIGSDNFVAGYQNTISTSESTVIGYQSSATSGGNSIAIGTSSQSNGGYSIALGNYVRALGQSSITIGNGPYNGGGFLDNSNWGGIMLGSYSSVPTMFIQGASQNYIWGNIGIAGVTTPQSEIDMQGSITMRGKPAGYGPGYPLYPPNLSPSGQGRIYYDDTLQRFLVSENGGIWQTISNGSPSSIRWKHDVQPLGDELTKLMLLRAVSFTWNKQFFGGKKDIGFIAEEVGKVFPDLVTYEKDGSGNANSLDYTRFAPILVKAAQEQQQEISDLHDEKAALEARISALEAKLK